MEEPLNDGSKPSVAVLGTEVLSQTDTEIHFSISFALLKDTKNSEDALKGRDVHLDSLMRPSIAFEQTDFDRETGGRAVPFSAVLLIDQSGSMENNDKGKLRFKAAHEFTGNFGQDNAIMLWTFGQRRGNFQSLGDGFVKDTVVLGRLIDSLAATRPSGGSPLFRAQDSIIAYLDTHAPTGKKALVSFTDGVSGGGQYYQNAVASSIEHQIPLYNVGLLDRSKTLRKQALETHGAYMLAENSEQLLSVFGNLGSLIDGTSTFYTTEWVAKRTKGKFGKRGKISHRMTIRLSYGEPIQMPFDLEW